MQDRVARVAAVVQEIVGCLVLPSDLHHPLRRNVIFAEMRAESALTIVHRFHSKASA